jgi:hypothetical protein
MVICERSSHESADVVVHMCARIPRVHKGRDQVLLHALLIHSPRDLPHLDLQQTLMLLAFRALFRAELLVCSEAVRDVVGDPIKESLLRSPVV